MEIEFDKDVIYFFELLGLDAEEIEEMRKSLEEYRKQLVKRALDEMKENQEQNVIIERGNNYDK